MLGGEVGCGLGAEVPGIGDIFLARGGIRFISRFGFPLLKEGCRGFLLGIGVTLPPRGGIGSGSGLSAAFLTVG